MAEGVGFEPTDVLPSSVFKTDAINRTLPPLHINLVKQDRIRTYEVLNLPRIPYQHTKLTGWPLCPLGYCFILKRRFWLERRNPLLDGWVVPHIGFTTNNHRQYPPFRRLMLFFQLSPSQPVDGIEP